MPIPSTVFNLYLVQWVFEITSSTSQILSRNDYILVELSALRRTDRNWFACFYLVHKALLLMLTSALGIWNLPFHETMLVQLPERSKAYYVRSCRFVFRAGGQRDLSHTVDCLGASHVSCLHTAWDVRPWRSLTAHGPRPTLQVQFRPCSLTECNRCHFASLGISWHHVVLNKTCHDSLLKESQAKWLISCWSLVAGFAALVA